MVTDSSALAMIQRDGLALYWPPEEGPSSSGSDSRAFAPPPAGGRWKALSVTDRFFCGIQEDSSRIQCWGGEEEDREQIIGPPPAGDYKDVYMFAYAVCGVGLDGSITCSSARVPEYNLVVPAGTPGFQRGLVAYGGSLCGLSPEGEIGCIGRNTWGLIDQIPKGRGYLQVSVGQQHICALKADGRAVCWGDSEPEYNLMKPPDTRFTMLGSGHGWTCGVLAEPRWGHDIECWGCADEVWPPQDYPQLWDGEPCEW
jgi:hypothetical protein